MSARCITVSGAGPRVAPPGISLVVTAGNEQDHIGDCLRSALGLPGVVEVVLVDDFSSDATIACAQNAVRTAVLEPRRLQAAPPRLRVFQRRYDGQAGQTNFAMDQARGGWLLLLDCDERLTPELGIEIAGFVAAPPPEVVAVHFPRANIVFGRWLRHGGNYPDYNHPRLVRRGRCRFETDRRVHCRMRVDGGSVRFENPLIHHSYASLEDYFAKFNRYTSAEAVQMAAAGRRFSAARMVVESLGHGLQRGVAQAAWRDGTPGLIYFGLGLGYDVVRHLKLRELSRRRAPAAAQPAAAGTAGDAAALDKEFLMGRFT